MQVTLKQVIDSLPGLREIAELKLPGVVSFKLAKVLRELEQHMQDYQKAREKVFETNGATMSDDGRQWLLPNDATLRDHINQENEELLEATVEINADRVPLSSLQESKISPQALMNVEWLIDESG